MKFMLSFAVLVLISAAALAAGQTPAETPMKPTPVYTYISADGSRLTQPQRLGADDLGMMMANAYRLLLPEDVVPVWVLGQQADGGALHFVYVTEDGRAGTLTLDLDTGTFEADAAPILTPQRVPWIPNVDLSAFDLADASPLTHPVLAGARLLYVTADGDLVMLGADGRVLGRQALNALPDARVVLSPDGLRAALYVDATARYDHNVLGDGIEAGGIAVLRLDDLRVTARITLDPDTGAVFEGIAPVWADVDGDGSLDLIATRSDYQGGAQIVAYNADGGQRIAQSDPIGRGYRWRHQLAYGPFAVDGSMNLIAVRTPHIGGIVEVFQYDGGGRLLVVAEAPGYTSHIIGTRNLDMAAAADFNADGLPELVVPTQDRLSLTALQRRPGRDLGIAWTLPVDPDDGGRVVTNLAVIPLVGGRLALALGLDTGQIVVWVPED